MNKANKTNEIEEYIYHLSSGSKKDFESNLKYQKQLDIMQQKQNVYSFINKQLCANNLALFIGSGCSVPAVPLMSVTMKTILNDNKDVLKIVKEYLNLKKISYLLDFLKNKYKSDDIHILISYIEKVQSNEDCKSIGELLEKLLEDRPNDKETIKSVFDDFYKSYSDIETLLNWIQNGVNYNPSDERLTEVYNKLKEKFIDSIPKIKDEKYKGDSFELYKNFYNSIFKKRNEHNSKVSIFTTNYDLFNECGLESNNIVYTTGFESTLQKKFDINQFKYRLVDDTNRYKDKWQPVSKEANLYKIHGSINWVADDDGILRHSYDNENKDEVVIYPTMMKHKETSQAPYSELFREFANCLQKKDTTLIIIGYGFPDEHINTIISQNLKNKDFNLIIFGNVDEKNTKDFYLNFQNSNGIHLIGGNTKSGKAHYFEYILDNFLINNFEESEDVFSE